MDCDFDDEKILKKINEVLNYIKIKGNQYAWNHIDNNNKIKPVFEHYKKTDKENKIKKNKKFKIKKNSKENFNHNQKSNNYFYNNDYNPKEENSNRKNTYKFEQKNKNKNFNKKNYQKNIRIVEYSDGKEIILKDFSPAFKNKILKNKKNEEFEIVEIDLGKITQKSEENVGNKINTIKLEIQEDKKEEIFENKLHESDIEKLRKYFDKLKKTDSDFDDKNLQENLKFSDQKKSILSSINQKMNKNLTEKNENKSDNDLENVATNSDYNYTNNYNVKINELQISITPNKDKENSQLNNEDTFENDAQKNNNNFNYAENESKIAFNQFPQYPYYYQNMNMGYYPYNPQAALHYQQMIQMQRIQQMQVLQYQNNQIKENTNPVRDLLQNIPNDDPQNNLGNLNYLFTNNAKDSSNPWSNLDLNVLRNFGIPKVFHNQFSENSEDKSNTEENDLGKKDSEISYNADKINIEKKNMENDGLIYQRKNQSNLLGNNSNSFNQGIYNEQINYYNNINPANYNTNQMNNQAQLNSQYYRNFIYPNYPQQQVQQGKINILNLLKIYLN